MSNGGFEGESKDGRFGSGTAVQPVVRSRRDPRAGEDRKAAAIREMLFVELLGGLGDALISLQAIQALARSYPKARLTVVTFSPGGASLAGAPVLHEVVQ